MQSICSAVSIGSSIDVDVDVVKVQLVPLPARTEDAILRERRERERWFIESGSMAASERLFSVVRDSSEALIDLLLQDLAAELFSGLDTLVDATITREFF